MPETDGQTQAQQPDASAGAPVSGGAKRMAVQRFEVKIDRLRSRIRQIKREIKVITRQRLELLGSDEGYVSVVPTEDEMIAALLRKSDRCVEALERLLGEANQLRAAEGKPPLRAEEFLPSQDLDDLAARSAADRASEAPAGQTDPAELAQRNEDLVSMFARLGGHLDELGRLTKENEDLRALVEELRRQHRPLELLGADRDALLLAEEHQVLQGDLDIARAAIDVLQDERKSLRAELAQAPRESDDLKGVAAAQADSSEHKQRIAQLAEELRGAKSESETVNRALLQAREERAALEKRLLNAEALARAATGGGDKASEALRRELERVSRQLVESQAELRRQKEGFDSLITEATQDKRDAYKAREQLRKQEEAVVDLGAELDERTRQAEEIRSQLEAAQHGDARVKTEQEALQRSLQDAETRLAQSEQGLAHARAVGVEVERIRQENTTLARTLERARQERNEIAAQLESAKALSVAAREQIEETRHALRAAQQAGGSVREERNEALETVERAKDTSDALRTKLREAEEQSTRADIEIDSVTRKVDTLTQQLEQRGEAASKLEIDLDQLRSELAGTERAHRGAETERDQMRQERDEFQQQLESAKAAADPENSGIVAELESVRKGLAEREAELAKAEAERERLNDELKQAREQLTEALQTARAATASRAAPAAPAPAQVQVGPPPNLPGFVVLDLIGAGPNGRVYQARKKRSKKVAAFKVLHAGLKEDSAYVKRVIEVLPQVKGLNHPHILAQMCPGRMGSEVPIAMDYLEAGSLAARLQDGPLDEQETLAIAARIADALDAGHGIGLVHRNIKPANILFTAADVPLLSDYGLAVGEHDGAMYAPGGKIFHYGSPEVMRGGHAADILADIYGLGATLYHMVTGRSPFVGDALAVVRAQQQTGEAPWPASIRSGLSETTCHLIARLMARDKAHRPANPSALRVDLERAAAGQMPAAGPCRSGESVVAIPA